MVSVELTKVQVLNQIQALRKVLEAVPPGRELRIFSEEAQVSQLLNRIALFEKQLHLAPELNEALRKVFTKIMDTADRQGYKIPSSGAEAGRDFRY